MRLLRAIGLTALLTGLLGAPAASASTPVATPTARSVPGIAAVGPIFRDGLTDEHSCTASVLVAPEHDLIITAAHCVSGSGAGLQFVPGYDRGAAPYGVWTTTAAYVDPSWISAQDPQHDYAILRVAPQRRAGRIVELGQVVPESEYIAPAPRPGAILAVPGYPAGLDDQPIDCAVAAYYTAGFPSFDCAGYVGGTSGSPWLVQHGRVWLVAGVIGGLHQGGCVDYTSYSSAFGSDTYALWLRAATRQPPDVVPTADDDGC